jgi:hypothetical protein
LLSIAAAAFFIIIIACLYDRVIFRKGNFSNDKVTDAIAQLSDQLTKVIQEIEILKKEKR